jgi:hypothetical protein
LAVNWNVPPIPTSAEAGVIWIDVNTAAAGARTVRTVVAGTEPELAVMVVVPSAMAVAKPDVTPMVASVGTLEVHTTSGGVPLLPSE